MKVVARKNPRQEKLNKLRRRNIPASGVHVPVTDNLSSTEYKIRKEIAIMKRCRHPHVVRLLEVIDDKLFKKIYMSKHSLSFASVQRTLVCKRVMRNQFIIQSLLAPRALW